MTFQRISPAELKRRLDAGDPLLLLDVRRSEALVRNPMGIASAVPILLDESEPRVPDLPRETEMLAYCLCSGQASSTRAVPAPAGASRGECAARRWAHRTR